MHLYIFACKNTTNIWAGIGAGKWAVSTAESQIAGRQTRAARIRIGEFGLIYRSDVGAPTTPFIFKSRPDPKQSETEVWPEPWRMPFAIQPLGSPRRNWNAKNAARTLPFNKDTSNRNIASVFKVVGTAVFSPLNIGEDDWEMILDKLGEI